jgi:hypothetical protein
MRDDDFEPPRARRQEQAAARAERRRRGLIALFAAGVAAFIIGIVVGASGGDSDAEPSAAEQADAPPELPRGGRSLLPEYRLVGFYGAPQDEALGELGIGTPAEAGERLAAQAKAYEGTRPIMPVFELLATIAANAPGEDGLYRNRQPHSVIRKYLKEARKQDALLLLDIQPGRADFADEVRYLKRYLDEPDVGLALDPEWHVGPTEVPGAVIGSVSATEVNQIAADLAATVKRFDLPEKLFVIHQFTDDMVTQKELLEPQEGLATVLNVDGFGDAPNKIAKYRELHPRRESGFASGFKLFYSEDVGLMSPKDVLGLKPSPDLIVYE